MDALWLMNMALYGHKLIPIVWELKVWRIILIMIKTSGDMVDQIQNKKLFKSGSCLILFLFNTFKKIDFMKLNYGKLIITPINILLNY